jgi:N-acetylglucosaminyldiphosphoundecaprenol N-acetyl-beta-D-mannosaminyltransferase
MTVAPTYQTLFSFLATNPHCSVLPASLNDFYEWSNSHDAYEQLSLLVPDGMPVVWGLTLFSGKPVERIYGPELMTAMLEATQDKKHVLIGSKKTFGYFKKKYPKHKLYTLELPMGNSAEELVTPALLEKMKKIQPDTVWIGVGSPKQVELCALLQRAHPNTTYFCVGAAFDFLSGKKRQAPSILRSLGFEWLFRLLSEPSRLWKRYVINSPKGLLTFLSCLPKINVL